ncbi:hypothetical protein [Bosea thiooxidans]
MIAIFTVLGLILFSGGAYAIFDGWPYLVLERGFTQVIIGSIASTAGLILLSLAWVLREIRAVRHALQEDAEARAALAPTEAAFESARPGPFSPALVPTAAGAAAAGAVADALFAPPHEEAPAASQPAAAADRDLFGDLVRRLREPEPEEKPAETPAPEAQPLPDMFKDALAEPHEPHEEPPIAVATESHEPAEIVTAKVQPVGEDEALAHADDLAHAEDRTHVDDRHEPGDADHAEEEQTEEAVSEPEEHREYEEHREVAAEAAAASQEERAPPAVTDDLDEFSALRASLTGHLRQTAPEGKRVEPSLEPEADPFAAAEAWMDRAAPRKEPWFEPLPAANEPEAAEPASPPWPPRTGTSPFAEPPASAASEPQQAPAPEEPEQPQAEEAAPPVPGEDEAKPEGALQESPAAPEPAASEEGVVGAYQVGDAHFTIYADGSIRARTPDGEYSFSSMDELKVYLASEKSRLGV